MGWMKTTRLTCDDEICDRSTPWIPQSDVAKVRDIAARELGWSHDDGDDYCPRHS